MKAPRNQQGFSLLEVMIALAIFSISIVALYGIQTMTITQNYTANRITTATTWAADKIEDILSLKYDDLKDTDNDGIGGLGDSTTEYGDDRDADGSEDSPDEVYKVMWNVAGTKAVGVPLPNTKTVRIIVTTTRKGTGSLVDMEYIKHAY